MILTLFCGLASISAQGFDQNRYDNGLQQIAEANRNYFRNQGWIENNWYQLSNWYPDVLLIDNEEKAYIAKVICSDKIMSRFAALNRIKKDGALPTLREVEDFNLMLWDEIDAAVAPTCTATGLSEGKKCSVCGTVTVEQTVIAAASHKLTKVAAVAPTYTAAGNLEHYICACGALFADAEGKTATTAEAVKLAPLIKIEETKAEISTNAVDTAIKEAETTGSITIDLVEVADEEATKPESGSGSDTTTKPAPLISSAALPVASLQKVAEISEETTLTVNMTEVTVTMDAKTLAAVAEQSAGETVTLKVEKIETKALTEEQQAVIEDKEVAVVVSATLISNNVAISDFNGGEVTIALPFTLPEGTEGSDFQVYYVADDGTMTAHDTAYKNGCLVFSTTHFSDYVVVNTAKSVDPTVPNTGDQSHLMFFTTLLMISAAGIYLASRKMRRA